MKGLQIGYSHRGKVIRYQRRGWRTRPGESCLILIGPARSGKTTVLVWHLYEYTGSVICVDIKAQLSSILARHRQKRLGQRIVFINPLNEQQERLGHYPHMSINPLDGFDIRLPEAGLLADAIAESIVLIEGDERDKHWPESARDLIAGVVLAVLEYEPPHRRDLVTVYQRIAAPDFFDYAQSMVARGNPLIIGKLGRLAQAKASENREIASVHSTAMTQFRFMGNQAVMDCLRPTANRPLLRWQDLRKQPTTVFPIIPVQHMKVMGRFLRLVMGSALSTLVSTTHRAGLPVYVPWDEFAACGRMSIVTDVMAMSAGMNLTLMPVVQDAAQIRKLYGDELNSFLSVAGCQIFLPPRDPFTAKLISDLCGQREVIGRSRSVSIDHATGEPHVSDSTNQHGRPLMTPDEVMALGPEDMLVRVEGVPDVIHAKRTPYYRDGRFRGLDPDPYHPKKGWF